MATRAGIPQPPVAPRVRRRAVVRPDRDSLYPDRIRRRPEGANSNGLGTHLDPGTLDLWMTRPTSRRSGTLRRHRRAVRPVGRRLPHRRPAVPRLHHVLGVPHLPGLDRAVRHGPRPGRPAHRAHPRGDGLPDAAAAAGRRPRRRHVRRHRQPGVPRQREVAPAAACEALTGIPDVKAGDSVWWHCRHDPQRRARSRTSRAGATSCTSRPRPGARATRRTPTAVREAFRTGSSPSDFPEENYERDWANRFHSTTSTRPDGADSASSVPDRDLGLNVAIEH